jgi:hypothetical protein
MKTADRLTEYQYGTPLVNREPSGLIPASGRSSVTFTVPPVTERSGAAQRWNGGFLTPLGPVKFGPHTGGGSSPGQARPSSPLASCSYRMAPGHILAKLPAPRLCRQANSTGGPVTATAGYTRDDGGKFPLGYQVHTTWPASLSGRGAVAWSGDLRRCPSDGQRRRINVYRDWANLR